MIPLRDENPTHTTPYLTMALIAINILVFLTEPLRADAFQQQKYFLCKAAIPYEVVNNKTVGPIRVVTADGPEVIECPKKNVWGSIIFSMFLHGGFLHIAGNMLFLWVFGNNIEDKLGRWRYILFYLAAGIAATFAQSFVATAGTSAASPSVSALTPMVGASGAVAGVLGAYLLLFPRARIRTLIFFFFISVVDLPAAFVLGSWFILQIFSGIGSVGASASSGVAFFAHIGGFVAGMLLLAVLRPRRMPPAAYRYD